MACVYLVHWNDAEWRELAAPLLAAGHVVEGHSAPNRAPSWKGFAPHVAVISQERLPAHGREIADWVWSAKTRRHVPIVFVGGRPEKVAETKNRFPDAVYCSRDEFVGVIDDIVSGRLSTAPAPDERIKTAKTAKRPSATPLAQKLGIAAETRYVLVGAPKGFGHFLKAPREAMPAKSVAAADVVLVFSRSAESLAKRLPTIFDEMQPTAAVWLAWPKRTSGINSDLTDEAVRQIGLRSGLVDVKVCAIDETWSGLKFVVRVADRPAREKRRRK